MKQSYPMDVAPGFRVDFEALLAPVEGSHAGAGGSLRYDPVYQQIRTARSQDDPSVPMGEWERPLIKADWQRVAALCGDALATRSKDFQLAAWLCEAWTHLYQVEGLMAGTRLLTALAERYWPDAWPEFDADDREARAAPFAWLNDTLALVLTLNVPLLLIEGREQPEVNLAEWQRVITGGMDDEDEPGRARETLDKHAKRDGNLAMLVSLHQQIDVGLAAWDSFRTMLDERLDDDAPHLGRVREVLMRLSQAVTSLLGDHAFRQPASASASAPVLMPKDAGLSAQNRSDATGAPPQSAWEVSEMSDVLTTERPAMAPMPGTARVESRAHAYQLLELVARYLAEQEPHSPTPFLLRRAVAWGQMPLPELMREIVHTEGDMSRYLAMLGVE